MSDNSLDDFHRRLGQLTVRNVELMTDDEVMSYMNIFVEGRSQRMMTVESKYFPSPEEAMEVTRLLGFRAQIVQERRGEIPARSAVYLDVDGTLLDKQGKPAKSLHEFIEYVTSNYVCFWLTTHERDGDKSHLFEYLIRQEIPLETIRLMHKVWPTRWDILKTEGIDFNREFIWFEDQPTMVELKILKEHGKENSIYMCDRESGDGLHKWLQSVKV